MAFHRKTLLIPDLETSIATLRYITCPFWKSWKEKIFPPQVVVYWTTPPELIIWQTFIKSIYISIKTHWKRFENTPGKLMHFHVINRYKTPPKKTHRISTIIPRSSHRMSHLLIYHAVSLCTHNIMFETSMHTINQSINHQRFKMIEKFGNSTGLFRFFTRLIRLSIWSQNRWNKK